jgi:hypothetical protein
MKSTLFHIAVQQHVIPGLPLYGAQSLDYPVWSLAPGLPLVEPSSWITLWVVAHGLVPRLKPIHI